MYYLNKYLIKINFSSCEGRGMQLCVQFSALSCEWDGHSRATLAVLRWKNRVLRVFTVAIFCSSRWASNCGCSVLHKSRVWHVVRDERLLFQTHFSIGHQLPKSYMYYMQIIINRKINCCISRISDIQWQYQNFVTFTPVTN